MNASTPRGAVVRSKVAQPVRHARAMAWLLAGALLPLGACQPPNHPPVAKTGTDTPLVPPVTTAPSVTPATQAAVEQPVREKIVTIEKPVPMDEVVATVGDRQIRFSQLKVPLMEAHGLKTLFIVVQLELAKQMAATRGLVAVTPADVVTETDLSMLRIAPDADKSEYPSLIEQILQKQRLSRAEFDIQMEINANLRKIAESLLVQDFSENALQSAFNALYGETIRVRHIECTNMQQIAEAQQRLAAGVPFEAVARELSLNARTRPAGGELPPFSRAYGDLSDAFKDVAFALKEGEVSDPVQAGGNYHLIKLEKRIPPKAVKFEDEKEHVRQKLRQQWIDAYIKQSLQTMGDQVRAVLKIQDPLLNAQYQQLVKNSEEAAAKAAAASGQLPPTVAPANPPATQPK